MDKEPSSLVIKSIVGFRNDFAKVERKDQSCLASDPERLKIGVKLGSILLWKSA